MHAYLICTNEKGVDIQALLPDMPKPFVLHTFHKIKIDDVRNLKELLNTKGAETHIIYFDNFLDVAQNAFLKILEEPANEKSIVLITKSKSMILDTVLSRLIVIEQSVNNNQYKKYKDFVDLSIPDRLSIVNEILSLEHDEIRTESQVLISKIIESNSIEKQKAKKLADLHDVLYENGASAKQILEFIAVTL